MKTAELIDPPSSMQNLSKGLKGSKGAGIRYEKKVVKRIKERCDSPRANDISARVYPGQWISFEDAAGIGYAQPDCYLICLGFILLLECKLTYTDYAWEQLTGLYMPLLKDIYEVPVVPIQVCKNLVNHVPNMIKDIRDLYFKPKHGMWTWHYLAHY